MLPILLRSIENAEKATNTTKQKYMRTNFFFLFYPNFTIAHFPTTKWHIKNRTKSGETKLHYFPPAPIQIELSNIRTYKYIYTKHNEYRQQQQNSIILYLMYNSIVSFLAQRKSAICYRKRIIVSYRVDTYVRAGLVKYIWCEIRNGELHKRKILYNLYK